MSKHTILYVDDEFLNLLVFSKLFSAKYSILTAESGSEGLRKLEECPGVRAVVSDMKMPGMNGVEFVRLAKGRRPELKCFIMTGYDITEEIFESLRQRTIEECFSKPIVNIEPIEAAIDDALN